MSIQRTGPRSPGQEGSKIMKVTSWRSWTPVNQQSRSAHTSLDVNNWVASLARSINSFSSTVSTVLGMLDHTGSLDRLRLEHILSHTTPDIAHFNFFFQAEDGIRDPLVTGVQTCALPI